MSTSETITRTDLTNILNEVLPVQAGLRTTEVTSGNISLTILKSGSIVQIFSFGSFPATNDGVTIVTIPEGFKPKQTTDYTVFDVDGVRLGTLRFFYDGRIVPTFGNLKAGNVRACWTYISSADYIPADADVVIEQGTNANGRYRKWNSGIAECWIRTTQSLSFTAYGSLYVSNWNWDFPITFTDNPTVVCSEYKWGTGASWGLIGGATTTQATLRGMDVAARASGTTYISAYAIGYWK